jgi:hypothetical protein
MVILAVERNVEYELNQGDIQLISPQLKLGQLDRAGYSGTSANFDVSSVSIGEVETVQSHL